jgi:integrase
MHSEQMARWIAPRPQCTIFGRCKLDDYFWDVVMAEAPDEFREDVNSDPDWKWMDAPEVRKKLRPVIAEVAQTALFLASRGLVLDREAHAAFLDDVESEFTSALAILERQARGDFSPDETLVRFPKFNGSPSAQSSTGVTTWSLFEAWVKTKQPAAATIRRWRAVFLALKGVYPRADTLTVHEARKWMNELIGDSRSAKTVREVWLSAARTVFSEGVKRAELQSNPFAELEVTVPRRTRTRETAAFTEHEAQVLLRAATNIGEPKTTYQGAQRWVFWLAAYTGARAGEITQLRGIDVEKRGAAYFAKLTPNAGTIKTGATRVVPLHADLIRQGFIEFVGARGGGPLFYNSEGASSRSVDAMNPRAGRAVKTRGQLGEWVRKLGVDDPELSPTHAWRHTFKMRAERAGISPHTGKHLSTAWTAGPPRGRSQWMMCCGPSWHRRSRRIDQDNCDHVGPSGLACVRWSNT